MTRSLTLGAAAGLVALALTGCGSAAPDESAPTSSAAGGLDGDITVFAAASLTTTFTELAESFEAQNPGTEVALNFAGSSDLATQIIEGAPADVFASADTRNMTTLTDAGLTAGDPVDFASNILEIAVPPGNPAHITDFADLAGPTVQLVVCAPQVPCGAASVSAAAAAGVPLAPVSEESSVTDVLGKVTSGQADAGLVYVTDVRAAGDAVQGIEFEEAAAAMTTYPIAALAGSAAADVAAAFVDYVTGRAGTDVLQAAGFGAP